MPLAIDTVTAGAFNGLRGWAASVWVSDPAENERAAFERWALSSQGLVDRITQPVLMINGKHDHLAPIGNIYFMLETGPATGKEARVYADAGHCAFKYYDHWAPATFRWLAEKLKAVKEGSVG